MKLDLYQECFEQESYYWWHTAKQKLVSVFLKKILGEKRIKVLDLGEISRILKPEGILIVIVPAYKFLWSYWDKVLGHYRRYSKTEIVSLLEKEGFYPLYSSYFHSTILPPATLVRFFRQKMYDLNKKINKNEIHSDFRPLPKWLNSCLAFISSFERQILLRKPLPYGVSVVSISKKNGSKKS